MSSQMQTGTMMPDAGRKVRYQGKLYPIWCIVYSN